MSGNSGHSQGGGHGSGHNRGHGSQGGGGIGGGSNQGGSVGGFGSGSGGGNGGRGVNIAQGSGTTAFGGTNQDPMGGLLERIKRGEDGSEQKISYWTDLIVGNDARILTKILVQAKADSRYDMGAFIQAIEYQGFDRLFYIKLALSKMSASLFCRFALLGALRGSNFQKIQQTCVGMPQDLISGYSSLGFVKKPTKKDHLTILRCTASIPHWCAFWLMKNDVAGRLAESGCPDALQFPAAAALPMSRHVRESHVKFSKMFSSLLPGGQFNQSIYLTMYQNQIPVSDIPAELYAILDITNAGPASTMTLQDVTAMTEVTALVRQ